MSKVAEKCGHGVSLSQPPWHPYTLLVTTCWSLPSTLYVPIQDVTTVTTGTVYPKRGTVTYQIHPEGLELPSQSVIQNSHSILEDKLSFTAP